MPARRLPRHIRRLLRQRIPRRTRRRRSRNRTALAPARESRRQTRQAGRVRKARPVFRTRRAAHVARAHGNRIWVVERRRLPRCIASGRGWRGVCRHSHFGSRSSRAITIPQSRRGMTTRSPSPAPGRPHASHRPDRLFGDHRALAARPSRQRARRRLGHRQRRGMGRDAADAAHRADASGRRVAQPGRAQLGVARIRQPSRLLAAVAGVRRPQPAGRAGDQRLGDRRLPSPDSLPFPSPISSSKSMRMPRGRRG